MYNMIILDIGNKWRNEKYKLQKVEGSHPLILPHTHNNDQLYYLKSINNHLYGFIDLIGIIRNKSNTIDIILMYKICIRFRSSTKTRLSLHEFKFTEIDIPEHATGHGGPILNYMPGNPVV